jgi:CRISPR-associated protein Cmr2
MVTLKLKDKDMKTYLAITIGPIYATIQQARRTRELWAASYVFSLLMRELLEVLKDEKIGELLAPVVTSVDSKEPENSQKTEESKTTKPPTTYNGAGIYPDRCFWLLNEK